MTDAETVAALQLECRRQAREIERLKSALTKHAVVSRHRMCSGGATRHWGYSCEICEAQVTDEENTPKLSDLKHALTCPLSLNSVETREMKP